MKASISGLKKGAVAPDCDEAFNPDDDGGGGGGDDSPDLLSAAGGDILGDLQAAAAKYKVQDAGPTRKLERQTSSIFLDDKRVIDDEDTKDLHEEIGRSVAGRIDMFFGISLPIVYVAYCLFLWAGIGFRMIEHVGGPKVRLPLNASEPQVLYY